MVKKSLQKSKIIRCTKKQHKIYKKLNNNKMDKNMLTN